MFHPNRKCINFTHNTFPDDGSDQRNGEQVIHDRRQSAKFRFNSVTLSETALFITFHTGCQECR